VTRRRAYGGGGGPTLVKPDPDPTDATGDLVRREISSLEQKIDARLHGMDEAVRLFDANLTRVPTVVDREIAHLRELVKLELALRAEFLQTELRLRDDRVRQAALDTKSELASALQAAEKSAQKQADSFTITADRAQASTTKQQDALAETLRIAAGSLNDKIVGLDNRVTRGEGALAGVANHRNDNNANLGNIGLIVGVLIGAAGLILPHLKP
jgi:predicted HAD superfamily Cof-like phosphohydrolase